MEPDTTTIPDTTAEEIVAEKNRKNNFQSAVNVGRKGFEVTGRFMTKVLDVANAIDRFIYGYRLKLFVWLSLIVVVIAPIIDWARDDWRERWTSRSTVFLFVLMIILLFAWVGSLRDDEGRWSVRRVWNRIWTYFQINMDYLKDSFNLPSEEMLYRLSTFLIIGSFCWKALQNISVFTRKLFHLQSKAMYSFEKITNNWTIWIFLLGVGLLAYLIATNKSRILDNLSKDIFPFLGSKENEKNSNTQLQITTSDLIFNAKDKEQIGNILNEKNPELFNDFIKSLQKWTPRDCQNEDDFQNSFHRQLKRNIPHATVEREFRIPTDETDGRKDRKADIVIDGTILIEMKKDFQVTATDRATTQVWNYSELWGDKGPVILLLCEANYEQAKNTFNPKLTALAKLDRRIIAFVARPQ